MGFVGGAVFGDGLLQQLEVAVPEFGVVWSVGVEVELLFGADLGIDEDVLPFSVGTKGLEKFMCLEGWGAPSPLKWRREVRPSEGPLRSS